MDAGKHYRLGKPYLPSPNWAESDPTKPWFVRQGDAHSDDFISMSARGDPSDGMSVLASFTDATTSAVVALNLTLVQQGAVFSQWGHGVDPYPPVHGGSPAENGFYYSLTRLQASGSLIIAGERVEVAGLTWMDHEYGPFGNSSAPLHWFLQDVQLSNGVHINHYHLIPAAADAADAQQRQRQQRQRQQLGRSAVGAPLSSLATVQLPNGSMYFDPACTMTPFGDVWVSSMNVTFFTAFRVVIPSFHGDLNVTTLLHGQDFPFPASNADVYEGVSTATGEWMGEKVFGQAWIEQDL